MGGEDEVGVSYLWLLTRASPADGTPPVVNEMLDLARDLGFDVGAMRRFPIRTNPSKSRDERYAGRRVPASGISCMVRCGDGDSFWVRDDSRRVMFFRYHPV